MRIGQVAIVVLGLCGAACGILDQSEVAGDTEAGDEGDDPDLRDVNWHEDVAPVVAEHCQSCHHDGGLAPFSLESYEAAKAWSPLMLEEVEAGAMPPWGAVDAPDCTPRHGWQDDPRLSDRELDVLAAWVENGSPEGDPDDAAPLPDVMPPALEGTTHSLVPSVPHTVEGEADDFQCVVLDPEIDQWTWLTGLDVLPDSTEVVHHAVLLAVPPSARDEVLAQAGDDGKYPCFGGELGPEGIYPVGLWVPGAGPTDLPDGLGVPLEADTLLMLQMHYHPVPGQSRDDATGVDLRLTEVFPGRNLLFSVIGNAATAPVLQPSEGDLGGVTMFRIPADASNHRETMIYEMPDDMERVPIFNVFPHMHYVGVNLQTKIEPPIRPPTSPVRSASSTRTGTSTGNAPTPTTPTSTTSPPSARATRSPSRATTTTRPTTPSWFERSTSSVSRSRWRCGWARRRSTRCAWRSSASSSEAGYARTVSETRSGGCLCGAVRYTAKLKDDTFSACHCGMCRRWTGGPLMSTAVEVSWESEDDLRVYTSSDWAERGFCVKCGSSLTYRITAQGPHHGVTVITVGSLDDSSGLEFGLEWFIDRKPEGYAFEGDRKRLTEAEVM